MIRSLILKAIVRSDKRYEKYLESKSDMVNLANRYYEIAPSLCKFALWFESCGLVRMYESWETQRANYRTKVRGLLGG